MSDLFLDELEFDPEKHEKVYFDVRDSSRLLEDKRALLEYWSSFEIYCDDPRDFKHQLAHDFHARSWEMYLGHCLALRSDCRLLKKQNSEGPDFSIQMDGELIHIEAICPKSSLEVEKVYEATRNRMRAFAPPNEAKMLLMTGALNNKIRQRNARVRKGSVSSDDPYYIALNTGRISFAHHELLLNSIFDIGHQFLMLSQDSGEVVEQGWNQRGKIEGSVNAKKKSVPANLFLSDEGRCISGIIFSSRNVFNTSPESAGEDLYVVPNPHAVNRCTSDFFDVGFEFVENESSLIKRKKYFSRSRAVYDLASKIYFQEPDRKILVAIDGVDGAGKTMLANELEEAVKAVGKTIEDVYKKLGWKARPVYRTSIDYFHNSRRVRYRKGKESPEGYFTDSFNYDKFVELVLDPLMNEGNAEIQLRHFDHRLDTEVQGSKVSVEENGILIVDGVFLQRDELKSYWDLTVFVDADFETTVKRCADRDGGSANPDALENLRYVNGQKIYLAQCDPISSADYVFDNSSIEEPRIFGM